LLGLEIDGKEMLKAMTEMNNYSNKGRIWKGISFMDEIREVQCTFS
jgi:hypothetical protein